MDRVNAQQARRILDRLVGYKLSPLLWRKVRKGLSAGRVQSVAVRLVVEREREIEGFKPQEYWTLEADLARQSGRRLRSRPQFRARLHRFEGKELPLPSEGAVRPHLAALERAAWHVGEVRLGERKRRPAAPFTTSTLQQEASRRLSFDTRKTMRLAQQLYEGVDLGSDEGSTGLITYMRTDSMTVSAEAQAAAREYILSVFGDKYAPDKPPVYRTRSKLAQEAHEAVRPTSVARLPANVKQFLSRDQFRLYELIWQRFVASQMAPAVYDTVSADVHAGAAEIAPAKRPYLFRAAGSTLRFDGFLALYAERDSDEEIEAAANPVPADLINGEALDLLKLLPEQHFTQPPPRYSEATLVKELEENGIGRPSTYAAILSTIVDRGYVEMQDKRLAPTETGQLVNDLLVEHFPDVLSVDFTARMEGELDDIADGRPWVPVIDEFYSGFAEDLERADKALPKLELKVEPEFVGRDCPLCGNPLVYREGKFGRFIGCSKFPDCRHTEQILVKIGVSCPKCGGELLEKRTRRGKTFYGCINYPECDWTNWKLPIAQPCRACGGLLVQATRSMAKCTNCGEQQPIVHVASRESSPT
jgi:DNA topoisomerase-1